MDKDVIIILVGDYGMVGKFEDKMIYLEDFVFEVLIFWEWVMDYIFVLYIWLLFNFDVIIIYSSMVCVFMLFNMNNVEFLEIYLKE